MKLKKILAIIAALALLPASGGTRNAARAEAGGWRNVLLLGTDRRSSEKGWGNADCMIVLSVNPDTREAKLTSFMRDLWVKIPGVKGMHKLNAACRYGGPERVMATLNACFDLDLERYALVDMGGLAEIIDRLGGLRLDVTEAERRALNRGLVGFSGRSGEAELDASGPQVLLSGDQAVAYARIRRIDSDYRRTERQRALLKALARRLREEDPIALAGLVGGMAKHVRTNLDLGEMLSLAALGREIDPGAVKQYRVPAEGTYRDGMFGNIWRIEADMERNRALLDGFLYG